MSLLRRALAGATVAVALLASTAPADAASSATCVRESSTRLLTANNGEYKIWLQKVTSPYSADTYHLCWRTSSVSGGDLVIRTPFRGDPTPTVAYVVNDPSCPDFFTVQDPVQLVTELATQLNNPYGLCLGVGDGRAVRVSVGLPWIGWPNVELWLDKYTTVTDTYCLASSDWQCDYWYYDSVRVL